MKSKRSRQSRGERSQARGQLRIGDHWNAITILALSQSNPLKAIAEFVENSIDAGATKVHIFRGKKNGQSYLRIVDNGNGIPKDESGIPDFKYVATHICNSIKRHLKARGAQGIQGEFGIGLLSFWTVGEQLTLRSADQSGHVHQMIMRRSEPGYEISKSRALLAESGTELIVQPLLPGLKLVNGEKLQWFIGMELRNRLLGRGVEVYIHDLVSRNEYVVEPQRFEGRKLALSEIQGLKHEIYLNSQSSSHRVGLYRQGTRVFEDIQSIPDLDPSVWGSGYFAGFLEWPDIQLTPGSRLGVIQDEKYETMVRAIVLLEALLREEMSLLKKAEEEEASRATHATLHRAFRDALGLLPPEEYDWFELRGLRDRNTKIASGDASTAFAKEAETGAERVSEEEGEVGSKPIQPAFFEFPGPLFSVRIAPASCLVPVEKEKKLRAIARDRKGTPVSEGLRYRWEILDAPNGGILLHADQQEVSFQAPAEPCVIQIRVVVIQAGVEVSADAVVTVTDSLVSQRAETSKPYKGLPSFTYERSPGELWRSRFDAERNLISVNSGHRDFLFASSKPNLKLRYLVRLFSKELVLANFQGLSQVEIVDRQIEVSLRAEEFLK